MLNNNNNNNKTTEPTDERMDQWEKIPFYNNTI